ncbi:unnamed protein product [Lathyrus sativus]|nr:unnamed protein product [Lathyrus sativus]
MAASQFLACKSILLPFKFLGLSVGGNHRQLAFWRPIISYIRKRLSSWKGRLLSIGGRVTLINFVLTNFPIHHLSFFKVPTKWLWRFTHEHDALWYDILEARYGNLRKRIISKRGFVAAGLASLWWKDIIKIGDSCKHNSFLKKLSWKLGDGELFSF